MDRDPMMTDALASTLLAPLLLVQGLYVRAVTPRLPEAEGARSGESGQGAQLRLLIVGDSAAAGVGVDTQCEALSGQLVERLSRHARVSWQLVARTGDASADLIDELEGREPAAFDVALVSVGVNDVTGRTPTARWRRNLARIVTLLTSRFGVRRVILTSVPPMHVFPALPQPLRWWLGRRATRLNGALEAFAAGDDRCSYLAPGFPLEPDYMADDGFHPGARAYRLWARSAADLIGAEA